MGYKISEELAKDIIITCREGASNYWAWFRDYDPEGGTVTVIVPDEGHFYHINVEAIQWAAEQVTPGGDAATWVFDYFPDDFDATTADVLLQLAIFGEVVYG